MNPQPPKSLTPLPLEQLLRRSDIWRGQSYRFTPQATLSTGHDDLNAALLNKGWPLGSLVEICQRETGMGEWLLLAPALLALEGGYIVLLNPPALPFAQGLIKAGMDLDRVLVVETSNKADFLASFVELARAESCEAVLAWQARPALNYTELRKCLLAAADGKGLYVMFRALMSQQQSSPASLRLRLDLLETALQVDIFKQKGITQQQKFNLIHLPLPNGWQGHLPHSLLDHSGDHHTTSIESAGKASTVTRASNTIKSPRPAQRDKS